MNYSQLISIFLNRERVFTFEQLGDDLVDIGSGFHHDSQMKKNQKKKPEIPQKLKKIK